MIATIIVTNKRQMKSSDDSIYQVFKYNCKLLYVFLFLSFIKINLDCDINDNK